MLPGFNHNVRYQDRTFHVQTEDNGVNQARLVTQTFIDGQLVDIARGSYRDILDAGHDEKTRTEKIRLRMQEQHKGQMKRLVGGALDERIRTLFGEKTETVDTAPPPEPKAPPRPSTVPPGVRAAAEALPSAQPEMATLDMEPPHPALQPTPSKSEPPGPHSHPDFLNDLDEEMRRQVPWRPTDEQLAAGDRFAQGTQRTEDIPRPGRPMPQRGPRAMSARPNPASAPPVVHRGTAPSQLPTPSSTRTNRPRPAATSQPVPRPGAGRAAPGRPAFPPAGDTIVDMGLPAALKETLERRRAAAATRSGALGPAPRPAAPPPAHRPPPRAAPAPQPPRPRGPSDNPNDTMLEIDAAQLHAEIAAQRARLRQAGGDAPATPPAAPNVPGEAPRGNIVVVERSLDDVILGYLSDED